MHYWILFFWNKLSSKRIYHKVISFKSRKNKKFLRKMFSKMTTLIKYYQYLSWKNINSSSIFYPKTLLTLGCLILFTPYAIINAKPLGYILARHDKSWIVAGWMSTTYSIRQTLCWSLNFFLDKSNTDAQFFAISILYKDGNLAFVNGLKLWTLLPSKVIDLIWGRFIKLKN